MLTRYAALDAEVAARHAETDALVAQMRAETDALNEPAEVEQKRLFMALKPWWAVSADDVTGGKRKTWELGGCLIGHRIGNPTLAFPKPETNAVDLLQRHGFKACLRVEYSIDKPHMLKFLACDFSDASSDDSAEAAQQWQENAMGQQQLIDLGFSVAQKETFFIDRLPPKGEATETLLDPQALQVAA